MPRTFTSAFSEPEDFEAALSGDGVVRLLVTGPGQFRARLTRIILDHMRLSAAVEELRRIAFVAVPAGTVLGLLPAGGKAAPVVGGIELRAGEMVTVGPGQQAHARIDGPCSWSIIQLPARDLLQYGSALNEAGFAVPPGVVRWRPPPGVRRSLGRLHQAAIRTAETRSGALIHVEAAHGLEQQLIHALVECLSPEATEEETSAARRHRGILAGFEDLLQAEPRPSSNEIGARLGVSERLRRECCSQHLGMGPSRYSRLRRMQQAHRDLRNGNPGAAEVSEVAQRYGFPDPGRFAAKYRAIYGQPLCGGLLERRLGCLCTGVCESDKLISQGISVK